MYWPMCATESDSAIHNSFLNIAHSWRVPSPPGHRPIPLVPSVALKAGCSCLLCQIPSVRRSIMLSWQPTDSHSFQIGAWVWKEFCLARLAWVVQSFCGWRNVGEPMRNPTMNRRIFFRVTVKINRQNKGFLSIPCRTLVIHSFKCSGLLQ
jgi:hypothetical protein